MDGTTYPMTFLQSRPAFITQPKVGTFFLVRCRAPQWLKRKPLFARP
jgi:hypothetical protein